jgi:hypothetical protein
MRSFLLQHFLSDADMAAEMHAGRGAAHYDMDQYTVRSWGWTRHACGREQQPHPVHRLLTEATTVDRTTLYLAADTGFCPDLLATC